MPARYVILLPLLDDWASLARLIDEIAQCGELVGDVIELVVVDDGSATFVEFNELPPLALNSCIERVEIIRLASNLGHQRAIAVGLSAVAVRTDLDCVIVMDSDGEDRPDDIPRLMLEYSTNPDRVIFARRAVRSEGTMFKAGYHLYKLLFRAMTGRDISFGNFSLLPMAAVRRIVHMPELWNNLPATIIRSRLHYRMVDTIRGVRYAGVSRMNMSSLIAHGLSAMAVYADVMFVRVLMAASAICALTLVAMALVIGIRLTTSLAIPGWATVVFGNLLIIMLLTLVIIVATTFMVLASRSHRPFVPIVDTKIFVSARSVVARRQPKQAELTR